MKCSLPPSSLISVKVNGTVATTSTPLTVCFISSPITTGAQMITAQHSSHRLVVSLRLQKAIDELNARITMAMTVCPKEYAESVCLEMA